LYWLAILSLKIAQNLHFQLIQMGAQTGKPILSLLLREQMKLPLLFDAPGFVPPAIGGGLRRA